MVLNMSGGLFGNKSPFFPGMHRVISIPPHAMTASNPDTDQIHYTANSLVVDQNGVNIRIPVVLPNNCNITNIVVYGSESDETYNMYRHNFAGGAAELIFSLSQNINSIASDPLIKTDVNNEVYSYHILTSSLDATDEVYGAVVWFTYKEEDI